MGFEVEAEVLDELGSSGMMVGFAFGVEWVAVCFIAHDEGFTRLGPFARLSSGSGTGRFLDVRGLQVSSISERKNDWKRV